MKTATQTPQQERSNAIINTLIHQLGGRRFFVFTGSKPKYKKIDTDSPEIMLKLTRNQSKANYLKITFVSGLDLYKMEFIKCHASNIETVKEYNNVYDDMLQQIFTSVTGLYTTL